MAGWHACGMLVYIDSMSFDDPALDLSSCEGEPIHIPGSIQPHGVLLSVAPESGLILQTAGDYVSIFGCDSKDFIGQGVEAALGGAMADRVRETDKSAILEPIYLGSCPAGDDAGGMLDVTAHHRDGVLIIEIEPSAGRPATAAETLSVVRRISAKLDAASDLHRLLQVASAEFRSLTGFDRVMIYRFLDDGAGCVAAEDKLETLPPFLNHHYPASDIPKQARALYLRNLIRVIPDAGYTPRPVEPALNPVTHAPLDMSDCSLRSVSPIHLQYLKNMGVTASMSVSLVVNGQLWGLISCHHHAPRLVPYELRETCKHVGEILSQQIKAREEASLSRQAADIAAARDELVEILSRSDTPDQALLDHVEELRRPFAADGVAMLVGDKLRQHGHTPAADDTRAIARWVMQSKGVAPYATNSLARDYAPAAAFAPHASGLLATVVSPEDPVVVMWFRAEQVETIEWAGNPHKPVEASEGLRTLTPRTSFEAWKETVRNRSRPWSRAEINGAHRIGRAALDLIQRQRVATLNVQLRRTLSDKEVLISQKDLLMQEVNHRVQNSLQLVNSMLHLQAQQSHEPEVRAQFEEASRRIMAVSTVHRRLWQRSDQIESVDFGTYLEELRDDLLETWGNSWAGHVRIHSRQLLVPTDKAIVLALVVTELLTNAVKYAYKGEPGPIDVHLREDSRGAFSLVVSDQGAGMPAEMSKGGLGSRLVQALVGQVGGEISVAARSPGTAVSLVIPC